MYSLIAKWTILPGNESKVIEGLVKLEADVRSNEPDTLSYMVFTPDFDEKSLPTPPAGEVIFIEVYKDKEAFLKHIHGDTFVTFVKDYGSMFLSATDDTSQPFVVLEVLSEIAGFTRLAQ